MTTLDKIKMDGEIVIDKIKTGERITTEDRKMLKIFNSLFAKKQNSAGKRKGSAKVQKP